MRIRKNAKLSTIMQSTAPEWKIERQVCQLNQSPWDVINFSDKTCPTPASLNQFGGNVSKSLGDSAGVKDSMKTMIIDCEDDKGMEMETKDANGGGGGEEDKEPTKIKKMKFCKELNKKTTVSTKRGVSMDRRTRLKKEKSSSSGDFYYYSGFGPSWGKRRADRNNGGGGEEEAKIKSSKSQNKAPPPLPSLADRSEELDFIKEEDDDYEQKRSSNGGKKRVRKVVKVRSLKSLM